MAAPVTPSAARFQVSPPACDRALHRGFCCAEAALVIEVDGGIHHTTEERDAERQAVLEALGLIVLRFTNENVSEQLEETLMQIDEVLQAVVDASG